jgi:hypothetical protein
VVAGGVILVARPAAAAPPLIEPIVDEIDMIELEGVCSRSISIAPEISGTQRAYLDRNGNVTMLILHVVEQDTFSANGVTLVGDPFTYNFQVTFDTSGNITHIYNSGLIEKIRLPDGSLFFITAGRLDWIETDAVFRLWPDVGTRENRARFCSAFRLTPA